MVWRQPLGCDRGCIVRFLQSKSTTVGCARCNTLPSLISPFHFFGASGERSGRGCKKMLLVKRILSNLLYTISFQRCIWKKLSKMHPPSASPAKQTLVHRRNEMVRRNETVWRLCYLIHIHLFFHSISFTLCLFLIRAKQKVNERELEKSK